MKVCTGMLVGLLALGGLGCKKETDATGDAGVSGDAGVVRLADSELVAAAIDDPGARALADELANRGCAVALDAASASRLEMPTLDLVYFGFTADCGDTEVALRITLLPEGDVVWRSAVLATQGEGETWTVLHLLVDDAGIVTEDPRDRAAVLAAMRARATEFAQTIEEGMAAEGSRSEPLLGGCTTFEFVYEIKDGCTLGGDACLDCMEAVTSEHNRWDSTSGSGVGAYDFVTGDWTKKARYFSPIFGSSGFGGASDLAAALCTVFTTAVGPGSALQNPSRFLSRTLAGSSCGQLLDYLQDRLDELKDHFDGGGDDCPDGRGRQNFCYERFSPETFSIAGGRPFCPDPDCGSQGLLGCGYPGDCGCGVEPSTQLVACDDHIMRETDDCDIVGTGGGCGELGYCDYYPDSPAWVCPCAGGSCSDPAAPSGTPACADGYVCYCAGDRVTTDTEYVCCGDGWHAASTGC